MSMAVSHFPPCQKKWLWEAFVYMSFMNITRLFLILLLYTVRLLQDVQSWYLCSLHPVAYHFHLNGLVSAYQIIFVWGFCDSVGRTPFLSCISAASLTFAFTVPLFYFPSMIAEENGHANTPQKGLLNEDASITSGVIEAVSKSALSPQVAQVSEEQNAVPTPVKKTSKTKPQIDVKAELEKRQGGKQLLNLVVIGNTVNYILSIEI